MSTVGPESFPKMEHIHGVDVSWMTHGNPKDKIGRRASLSKSLSQQALDIPYAASNGTSTSEFAPASAPTTTNGFRTDMFSAPSSPQNIASPTTTTTTIAKPIPIGAPSPARPGFTRTGSDEVKTPPIGVSPQRRNSWFSNIASKLSSANGAAQSPPQTNPTSPKNAEFSVPKVNPAKNAVLQHATKHEGDGPYIPAPPGRAQGGVFHIFRRLSSSNGTLGPHGTKGHNHGLVERKVLNVDQHRERCDINGLNQAKLRRVAFCVDVEIAPMPRYGDDAKKTNAKPQVQGSRGSSSRQGRRRIKEKEKKKKSEEERKARKEKKRKLAEANGIIPMEIHVDSDSSDDGGSSTAPAQPQQLQQQPEASARRTQSMPTTNPVRIYRRCCQLRETPILKRITEQLMDPANMAPEKGVVEKLDLTGYWLQLPDLVTLGDYLAVVPIKEIIMDNCGLNDEGLRPQPNSPATQKANDAKKTMDLCQLFSKSLAERLGGSTLTLLSLGETGITTEQLGLIMDGVLKCGIKKIVLANNDLTDQGLAHVKRFLATPTCEGLDLGGNDLREHIDKLTEALDQENCPLWALSLADCNLTPAALSKLLPTLVKLPQLRYIDLSHNQELFNTEPSAVAVLRKYLPAMPSLKRIHLVDCALTPEQVIALAEILPEIPGLAHVSFLENPQIVELTDANTDEAKESACALFASLLSAARVSGSLVAVDIEVPNEQSSDLVKAMAKQVVAYCLRNMGEQMSSVSNFTSMTGGLPDFPAEPEYPDVLQRLVGADVTQPYDPEENLDIAPDEDYVIGGTGVVKALTCCLNNCDEEFRRQSGEFVRDGETGHVHTKPYAPVGKAKETSKHLLLSARKIRTRLQPAIQKARDSHEDTHAYHRLIFLDNTLKGIIKRFEDEFPDTKEVPASTTAADSASFISSGSSFTTYPYDDAEKILGTSISSIDLAPFASIWGDDAEDPEAAQAAAFGIKPRGLVRSNSSLSLSSRALADEEARVLRAGHKFRSGIVKPEHYMLLNCGVEMIGADPNHARLLHELFDELDDDEYTKMVEERGAVAVFIENKEDVVRKLRDADPVHWDRFVESQEMARKNVEAPVQGNAELSDKCEANMKSLNAAGTGAQGTSELTMRLKGAEKEKEKVAEEQKK
ncbi:putative XRS2/NBS1 protein [Sordaria macrospora k-hell]|uniref:Putative XRS2/NBS1 protein n=1 Tax=Sordaria macrospora (strain ATCC MYA-333 / DSM 997 / K(L3346) / K-hell) TaxID=771870 RepID=F7W427_SORMK|nr:putative XRS2/NBS1 protein [Sordaria macrospora k-hell]CCC12381.1 putative XRS2/NBS1 protein [Sordaria macrospora k-hell]